MRRVLSVLLAVACLAVPSVAGAGDDHTPPDPRYRVQAWLPQPPGTVTEIRLQYGPYVVHPGSDLSRVDVEIVGADGFVISAKPRVLLPSGEEPPHTALHVHHAHWVWVDPEAPGGNRWFFGTGEEETQGGGEEWSLADPEAAASGVRHGVEMREGDQLAFVSMLHNKTSQALTVWLEGKMTFVHGTREEIKGATGLDYHPLTPTLHGTSFNVPRTGGLFTWPLEATSGDRNVKPGVGHVWTSPFDGTIIIGAGHLHPGGKEVVVSNLGRQDDPCPSDDGDVYPGRTILRIPAFYRDGIFPSEEFQMGITKHGWRAKIRKGDRLAINGIYDATAYAYPDAMSFFGFYTDQEDVPEPGEECTSFLADDPDAPRDQVVMAMPNRDWFEPQLRTCQVCDNLAAPAPPKGPEVDTVQIAGFQYLPGDQATAHLTGAPVVKRGRTLTFVNEDWFAGLVRHTVTTCRAPCNGPYVANYPFHDGVIESGALGFTPVDTYINKNDAPMWQLDTSGLDPGLYTYFCRLHPWMRGSLYVE